MLLSGPGGAVAGAVTYDAASRTATLTPSAALAGGTLLTVADTAARSLIAPQQLPVGVLTALIGVPVFLFLLARHPR